MNPSINDELAHSTNTKQLQMKLNNLKSKTNLLKSSLFFSDQIPSRFHHHSKNARQGYGLCNFHSQNFNCSINSQEFLYLMCWNMVCLRVCLSFKYANHKQLVSEGSSLTISYGLKANMFILCKIKVFAQFKNEKQITVASNVLIVFWRRRQCCLI